MMIKKTLLALTLLFSVFQSYPQNTFMDRKGFRVNAFGGYHFAPNRSRTNQSLDGYCTGVDIGLVQWGLGYEQFTETYGYPRLGIDARIVRMNKVDTFGYCIALLPTFEIEMLHRARYSVQAKISYGVNYNTKRYDSLTNFDNRAVSTRLNFAFDAGLLLHYFIKPNLELNFGSGLYHVSNGSLKMPNGGINILYANAGVTYYPRLWIQHRYRNPDYKITDEHWAYYMGYIAGGHRQINYFSNTSKFWVASLVNQGMLRLSKLYSGGLGIDAFYDASQALLNDTLRQPSDVPLKQKLFLAIGFANRIDIGRVFIPFGIYQYVYEKKYVKQANYIRFGLGVQITPRYFVGSFFKGTVTKDYKLQSDFMEWSIGLRL